MAAGASWRKRWRRYTAGWNMKSIWRSWRESWESVQDISRKLFVQRLGIGCTQYITMLRIAKAKEYLRDWDKGVTEAAALAGFNSPQYFCRVFRKHTGMTPAEYKNMKNDDC